MPSLAKLMPNAGSGNSGGTSSTGRPTFQVPSLLPVSHATRAGQSGAGARVHGHSPCLHPRYRGAHRAATRGQGDAPYKHRFSLLGSHSAQKASTSGGRGASVGRRVRGARQARNNAGAPTPASPHLLSGRPPGRRAGPQSPGRSPLSSAREPWRALSPPSPAPLSLANTRGRYRRRVRGV